LSRRQAQEQQKFLVGETKHRVKATVQAIAMQTLRRTPGEERDAFIAQLNALAKAHELLSVKSWDRAPLRDVVGTALGGFQEAHRERFLIDGPAGLMRTDHCYWRWRCTSSQPMP